MNRFAAGTVALLCLLNAGVSSADEAAPPRRADPLALSFGLGSEAIWAHRYDPNTTTHIDERQIEASFRLGAGVAIADRAAVLAEAHLSLPLAPLPGMVSVAAGIRTDWFLRPAGSWHLRFAARRAIGKPGWFFVAPGSHAPEFVVPDVDVWLFEAGVGRMRREDGMGRGWTLTTFGGPLWVWERSGWMAGVSAGYGWSRF